MSQKRFCEFFDGPSSFDVQMEFKVFFGSCGVPPNKQDNLVPSPFGDHGDSYPCCNVIHNVKIFT